MQRNRIAQSSKVDKTINYLRRSDLRGLAKEVAEYTRWRSNVGFGWKMDPILIFRDVITKYGIGQNSQFGEGSVLRQLLTKYPVPFLVDVGAHDGRSWSNSRPFMLQGWHGILIEPLPKVYQELSSLYQHNSKATCLNLACSDTT